MRLWAWESSAFRAGMGAESRGPITPAPRMGHSQARQQGGGILHCLSTVEGQSTRNHRHPRNIRHDGLGGKSRGRVCRGGLYRDCPGPVIGNGAQWRPNQGFPLRRRQGHGRTRRSGDRKAAARPGHRRSKRSGRLLQEPAALQRQSRCRRILVGRRTMLPFRHEPQRPRSCVCFLRPWPRSQAIRTSRFRSMVSTRGTTHALTGLSRKRRIR